MSISVEALNVLLIADDDADFALIRSFLDRTESSFQLQRARTLAEAREMFRNSCFDAVLADLSLPDSRGMETIYGLRDFEDNVPVIILSDAANRELELRAIMDGVQDFLPKSEISQCTLERAILHAMHRYCETCQKRDLLRELRSQHASLESQARLLEKNCRRLAKMYETAYQFVDNASHEIRTPLTVIKDYVSLLREGIVGPVNDEQQRLLRIAAVRAEDLNVIVNDMLDAGKIESGLLGAWRRSCKLADIFSKVLPALRGKAESKEVELAAQIENNIPLVFCDPEKIGRVITNLVFNAIKFSGSTGLVRLWARHNTANGEVLVGVSDMGPGIPPDEVQQIFKRFRQGTTHVHASCNGCGLGLSIAKELVELNLGEIYVESTEGRGSTFWFSIPVADPRQVLKRYLHRVATVVPEPTVVSFIECSLLQDCAQQSSGELDSFLQSQLQLNDILFRPQDNTWAFVICEQDRNLEQFVEQIIRAKRQFNRNCPHKKLPEINVKQLSRWQVPGQVCEALTEFERLLTTDQISTTKFAVRTYLLDE